MRNVSFWMFLVLVMSLTACGGASSSSGIPPIVPPVHASGGFTVASLNGGYAYGVSGISGAFAEGGTGVISADGNGNLTSGEETDNIGGTSCHSTLAGTYTVNSNGTGTANVNISPDATSAGRGCGGGSVSLSLVIGNGGSTLILASQDPNAVDVVTAIKQ